MRSDNLFEIPPDIPIPQDDGAARHLLGKTVPLINLMSTRGDVVNPGSPTAGLIVLYCYPRTGRPDVEALGGATNWNAIPGARGCTPQSCAYRDLHDNLHALEATVYGLSTQSTDYQREVAQRLQLPFPLLSDENFLFSSQLELPYFEVEATRLLKRITLIIRNGRIMHYFYPVYPPDKDAENVAAWIRKNVR